MSSRRRETWPGGYARVDAAGKKTYWIRRMVGGTRYELSTRCSTLRAAVAELERWEKDPAGYRPGGASADPFHLDGELVARFLKWSETKKISRDWRKRQRLYLAWWAGKLGRTDLRKVRLREILDALDGMPGRRQRIVVLKSLYSWLRQVEHRIEPAEDPTFGTLQAPQVTPAQIDRSKVVPLATINAVWPQLSETYRDALDLLTATGWHVTELHRFAKGGRCAAMKGEGGASVLEVPLHKSGAPHRTAVTEDVAEIAKRILERGGLSPSHFHRAIHKACDAAGVPRFGPGQMRHSVATWAVDQGTDIAAVSTFLGHKSHATTKKFYATHAVPAKVPTMR